MFRILRRIQRRLFRLLGALLAVPFWPLQALWRGLGGFSSKIAAWWNSRHVRDLLFGLPALLLLLMAGVLAASSLITDTARLRSDYGSDGEKAFQRKDYKAAKLLFERAVAVGEQDSEILYHLALCYEQLEDGPRLRSLIEELAPLDFARHPDAHLRVASQNLQVRPLAKENVAVAQRHLEHVIKLDPDNDQAHIWPGLAGGGEPLPADR
jgi:hypothetical protein